MHANMNASSTNGTFTSVEPFEFQPKDSNVFIRAQNLAKKYILLVSMKPDQVIWVDIAKFDKSNKRTKVEACITVPHPWLQLKFRLPKNIKYTNL